VSSCQVFRPFLERFFGVHFDLIIRRRCVCVMVCGGGGDDDNEDDEFALGHHVCSPVFVFVSPCRSGYFPQGGGEVLLRTRPVTTIKPITLLDRGEIVRITGRAYVAGRVPDHVLQRMVRAAEGVLRTRRFSTVNIESVREPNVRFCLMCVWTASSLHAQGSYIGEGCGIILCAETSTGCVLAASALGERKMTAEQVGEKVANELVEQIRHGGCVDEYLADQIVIFMALAAGVSRVRCGACASSDLHYCEADQMLQDRSRYTHRQPFTLLSCSPVRSSP
jgi:RNA 3'-terminal phosphate cyclase